VAEGQHVYGVARPVPVDEYPVVPDSKFGYVFAEERGEIRLGSNPPKGIQVCPFGVAVASSATLIFIIAVPGVHLPKARAHYLRFRHHHRFHQPRLEAKRNTDVYLNS